MAHEKLAKAIVREIPVTALNRFIDNFGKLGPRANGDACGNGCGNNCVDGIGLVVDRWGQAELGAHEIGAAQKDLHGLKAAVVKEIESLSGLLRG
jgi:hypothetical protein